MGFQWIDLEHWDRREYYEHFIKDVVCSYSITVNLDITPLIGRRLYPAMLWLLTRAVNQMPEFRTCLTAEGPGIFDTMHPYYTIFNQEKKTFSGIWTEYAADYDEFLRRYKADEAEFSRSDRFAPKDGTPPNTFNVSMLPWVEFSALNINVYDEGKFLLPIFTMGKYFERDGKRLLPLAIQVHHAVCDGYHIGRFTEILQNDIRSVFSPQTVI